MAWNEPGGNNRDPWGGGGRDQGPPDLDEVIRKLSDKLGGLLGGKSGGGGGRSGLPTAVSGIWLIVGIILIGWILSGIYIVDEGRRGVVLRFGRYSETTLPGPHWRLPFPFESQEIVNVEERRAVEIGYRSGERASHSRPEEALMLTQDENIVDIRLAVQYQIGNPRDFLFKVSDPEATLRQVVESATRETIGKSTMDFVLTEGRSEVVADIKALSQKILDRYQTGLVLTNVNLQDAQPPEEVQDAFADAIKAREDEQRLKNEAEAYANEVIPKARGQSARRLQESQAYKDQVVARAEGDASRFQQLLPEYQKAPEVTRERLYLEALEQVLSTTSKVLVDVPGGNPLLYLPLDKLIKSRESSRDGGTPAPAESAPAPAPAGEESSLQLRDTSRSRVAR
ncbi:MAG: FtsH protease activity modulator HflK [Candidatus Competibacteraceae bacterium]